MSADIGAGRARIYVSFADEDRGRVMELVRWLNDGGWHVRADVRHAFATGQDWERAAAKRLEACDVVLCVVTPGWLVSKFCHFEYSHSAKRGKFVLPVICDLTDVGLLPDAMRALPRVDLTESRMVDYLALKEVLDQAGSAIGQLAVDDADAPAPAFDRPAALGPLWLLVPAVLAAFALGTIWLWAAG
jgi:hypothetical protein